MPVPDIQRPRGSEPPPHAHRTTEHETQDAQSTKANKLPPVKRLDVEVTRTGEIAFASGTHCEVWTGQWAKGGRMEGGGGDVEKVRLHLIMVYPANMAFCRWP